MVCFTSEAMNCILLRITPFILIYWALVLYGYWRLQRRIAKLKTYERWALAAAAIVAFYALALLVASVMSRACI